MTTDMLQQGEMTQNWHKIITLKLVQIYLVMCFSVRVLEVPCSYSISSFSL